ncbi:major facilitator superfamily domain-containing protein [Leptodontidium sp. 2 PMI_412]|nr:major facilitator superfamily domain-containing protein [Leptodontidium sp. 2 PMI_412]
MQVLPVDNGDLENANQLRPGSTESSQSTKVSRADGGRDAWLFLAACFVFEALVWGFPFSFGVFQSYYSTHAPFSHNDYGIAAIGTCSTGVMYLFAPVSLYILEAWPAIRRVSSIVGLIIAAGALVASSFSTQVWHLIITQGVMYAIGGSLLYSPTMFYLDEWFVEKKGLAFGVMWAGVGASGLVFPFTLKALLDRCDFANTLRIWAILLFFLCTPLIYFIKPRLSATSPPTPRKKPSYAFLLKPTYLILQASNIFESLGFFLPAIYLPTYATFLHLSPQIGTLLLALLNLFSVVGAVLLGHLCDKMHVSHVIAISTFGSTFSVFLFWGPAKEVARLIVFAMVYGAFAGGYSALWAGMMKEVQKVKGCEEVGMGVLMGAFAAGRGIGAVASGPLSEILLNMPIGGVAGFNSEYGTLIVFTGASAFAGGVGWFVTRKMRGHVHSDGDGGSVSDTST